jgi:hypothetical protein
MVALAVKYVVDPDVIRHRREANVRPTEGHGLNRTPKNGFKINIHNVEVLVLMKLPLIRLVFEHFFRIFNRINYLDIVYNIYHLNGVISFKLPRTSKIRVMDQKVLNFEFVLLEFSVEWNPEVFVRMLNF